MSKQKLAEMVKLKMQQKREEEERNRPHYEVLQLLVKFQIEQYDILVNQISNLQEQISKEEQFLNKIDENCQELENTGKKNYPRYIIQPNFIASENIPVLTKQFFRKTSNTFLREDLLKKKRYEADCCEFQEIKDKYAELKDLELQLQDKNSVHVRITNQKRVRNLKQDLRLRALREQIRQLNETINQQKNQNQSLINEYQLKKTNLHERVAWSEKLVKLISQQKQLIQNVYNPVTYREYLKTVFGIRIKNESMQKNLTEVMKEINKIQEKTERNERFLEQNDNLVVIGKCADSPSKRKRKAPASLDARSPPTSSTYRKSVKTRPTSPALKEARSSRKSQFDKTHSSSLGKTTASSTFNLKQSSQKKRSNSSFSEFKNKKIKALQY